MKKPKAKFNCPSCGVKLPPKFLISAGAALVGKRCKSPGRKPIVWQCGCGRRLAGSTTLKYHECDKKHLALRLGKLGQEREVKLEDQPSITCPVCSMTSYNVFDVRRRYCGNCHKYHDDMIIPTQTPASRRLDKGE